MIDGDWVESKDQDPEGNVRLVQLADIGVGSFLDKSSRFMTSEKALKLRCTFLQEGDILVARMPDPLGRACQFPGDDRKCVTVVDVCIIRPAGSIANTSYVTHMLNSEGVRKQLDKFIKGTTRQRISRTNLEQIRIPLPPLPEQRRIAAILDQADALRARRREALAELDQLTQSIFIEMFGDPGINPMGWPEMKLSQLIIGKPNNGIFKKNEEYGDGLPVAWVEELFRGNSLDVSLSRRLKPTHKEIEQYGLRNGDVLFCRSSLKLAGIGYNNVYLGADNQALFECHLIRISPDKTKISPVFLSFALRMPNQRQKLFKFAKTVTMSTIDQDGLQQIELPLPPLESQLIFEERLKVIENIRKHDLSTVKELHSLVSSLQHRAFRGEL